MAGCLGVLAGSIYSTYAATNPNSFLSAVLLSDFNGNGTVRVGKVIYSAPPAKVSSDCDCIEPPEAYWPDADPLEIATNWRILAVDPVSNRDFKAKVLFQIVATTTGGAKGTDERRRIVALPHITQQVIDYRIEDRNGKFYLIDPPLPVVSLNRIIDVLTASVENERTAIALDRKADASPVGTEYRWLMHELGVLTNIRARIKPGE